MKQAEPSIDILIATHRSDKNTLPLWTKDFTVLTMSLLDNDSVVNCLKDKGIDTIIHLAALNEIDSIRDVELAIKVNTLATYRLLQAAHIHNIKKFIYFSTFHVYDKSAPIITENTPTSSWHPYAATHRAAEDFVQYYKHCHNMKTLIFRLSNAFGYPMDKDINRWTLVFNDLCRQVVTTKKLTLKSSGQQHRDFISLHDVARSVHHFMFVMPDMWGDGIFNLGGNNNMSILEVAEMISRLYAERYGTSPPLILKGNHDSNTDTCTNFVYKIDKLLKTGFTLNSDVKIEIFKTMDICKRL
ncbi:3-beta hydroxysteroid dehydrogenase/isomerase family protein [Candidatus Magnetobacterium bavaricum]|uniref:3-beta hydroxysteroid dehydrogenase/isomerase family protein n=1 Tax=Candidatus Magnetobacterium bavaricum TaxID=29290 RepID=A0A0F3GHM2_9BACT|nr:3-beta hydroxysteroid dehydrogenase/isomerase family protein [Candidatus Magnetobacterium bavaricum]